MKKDVIMKNTLLPICFLFIFVMLSCGKAQADSFYQLVTYTCDKNSDQIVVELMGAYNEEGEAMLAKAGPDMWEPWSLVSVDDSTDRITKMKTIKRSCILSDGKYSIEIGPEPWNTNIQGECGAYVGAWTRIKRGNKQLVRAVMGACRMDEKVVKRVVVKAGKSEPLIKVIEWADFYK